MTKGRVLVIDDEEDVREVLRLHLESAGYNVLEAEDGEVGINTLRMIKVDLILCDIHMPKVNGAECVEFLKKEAPGTPVVMVTGYPDTDMTTSFLRRGVKDYLVKPVAKKRLLGVVDQIVASGKEVRL